MDENLKSLFLRISFQQNLSILQSKKVQGIIGKHIVLTSYFLASFILQNRVFFYFDFLFRRCLKRQAIASKRFIENIFSKRQTCKKNVFYVSKHKFSHSQKKWKYSLEGTLVGVLFAAELEFPKILVPRLLQHTSNVNIETTGKSKQLQLLFVSSFLEP